MKNLGDKIKKTRTERKITIDDLADAAGVSAATVMRWEAGEREPRMDEARKIAKALHTTIAFLTGEGDNSDVKLRVATPNSVISLKQNGTIVLIGDDDAPESNVSFLRDFVYVPIMSPRTPACCGLGNGLEEVPMEADGISLVECDKLGFESRAHKLPTDRYWRFSWFFFWGGLTYARHRV